MRGLLDMKKEQTQRRKRGEVEIQPFGDWWIEQALRGGCTSKPQKI